MVIFKRVYFFGYFLCIAKFGMRTKIPILRFEAGVKRELIRD